MMSATGTSRSHDVITSSSCGFVAADSVSYFLASKNMFRGLIDYVPDVCAYAINSCTTWAVLSPNNS